MLSCMDNADSISHSIEKNEEHVLQESKYYKVVQSESLIHCYFYDKNQNVVKCEGPLAKMPRIESVDETLILFTYQSGTGTGTQWGYFFNPKDAVFSDVFQCIFDYSGSRVAFAKSDAIIVRDIFDEKCYYKEISVFSNEFSEVAFPFVSAEFIENGDSIQISYYSGDNYEVITEVFRI